MSESQDAIHIPLDIGTESVEEALRTVEELDEKLQELKKHALDAFQAATGLRLATQTAGNPITGAPGRPIDPIQTIKSALAGVQPAQYSSVISPQFAQAIQAVQQRQKTIEEAFKLFQASSAFKAGAPSAVAQAFRDYAALPASGTAAKPTPVTMATETLNALGQVLGRALTAPALTGLFRASAASGLGSLGLGGRWARACSAGWGRWADRSPVSRPSAPRPRAWRAPSHRTKPSSSGGKCCCKAPRMTRGPVPARRKDRSNGWPPKWRRASIMTRAKPTGPRCNWPWRACRPGRWRVVSATPSLSR